MTCAIYKGRINATFKNILGSHVKISAVHVQDLFGSKFVASLISCGYPNNVDKLYNSKPQKMFVPPVHQFVHFAFQSPKYVISVLSPNKWQILLYPLTHTSTFHISVMIRSYHVTLQTKPFISTWITRIQKYFRDANNYWNQADTLLVEPSSQ